MRVENTVRPGTPDVFYVLGDKVGWAELKYRKVPPARPDTPVFSQRRGLRKDQVVWWMDYLYHGGRGVLFVGVGATTFSAFAASDLVRDFNHMKLSDLRTRFTTVTNTLDGVL